MGEGHIDVVQQTRDRIFEFLNDPTSHYHIPGERANTIKKLCNQMFIDFESLSKPSEFVSEIKPSHEFMKYLLDTIDYIGAVACEKSISEKFKKFTIEFSVLVSNWNSNVSKSQQIKDGLTRLDRYINLHFSTLELIQQVKKLVCRMESDFNKYSPPVELAKHYLKSLDMVNMRTSDDIFTGINEQSAGSRKFVTPNSETGKIRPPVKGIVDQVGTNDCGCGEEEVCDKCKRPNNVVSHGLQWDSEIDP